VNIGLKSAQIYLYQPDIHIAKGSLYLWVLRCQNTNRYCHKMMCTYFSH